MNLKRWWFIKKLNWKIKPLGAKASIIFEGHVDTLQITIKTDSGEQFTQLRIGEYNYNHYLIENIMNQIGVKKAKENDVYERKPKDKTESKRNNTII